MNRLSPRALRAVQTCHRQCYRFHLLHNYPGTQFTRLSFVRHFSKSLPIAEKRYTKNHEWIEISNTNQTGTLGISQYASEALGDPTYVELPAIDLQIESGDSIGSVESVKAAADIISPVAGKVVTVNQDLESNPSLLKSSPEGDGWVAKIQITDAGEVQELMDHTAYQKFTEEHRG